MIKVLISLVLQQLNRWPENEQNKYFVCVQSVEALPSSRKVNLPI